MKFLRVLFGIASLLMLGISGHAADFNGDGKADILFHQASTGKNYMMLMNGRVVTGKGLVKKLPSVWNAAGFGDFDGNGTSDILFRQASTGKNLIMLMNGLALLSKGPAPALGSSWDVAGTDDFNGDGKADILFHQASTGKNYMMLMNGRTVLSKGAVKALPNSWGVAGVADFNGDGKADILFHQAATGKNLVMMMNGRTVLSKGAVKGLPKSWEIAAVDDYNGDGRADILYHQVSTGKNLMMLMNGRTLLSKGPVRALPATWGVVKSAYLPYIVIRDFGVNPDPLTSSVVNVMFHAQRGDTLKSVRDLTADDVLATQDGQPIAVAESFLEVKPVTNFPTTIKTALLLDTSGSVVVAGGLPSLKAAAKAAVAGMSQGQQMSIYLVDQVPAKLLQGYTSNQATLNAAIDSIGVTVPVGGPTTNLYGGLDSALRSWTTSFSQSGISYGNAILVTDGNDTAGVVPLSTVLSQINTGQKPVYTVGVGRSINWNTMNKISAYGKVFKSANFNALTTTMKAVNNEIYDFISGLYMAYYASPSRAGMHTLELRLQRNSNTDPLTSRVFGSFDATGFTNPTPVLEISGPTSIPVGGSIRLTSNLRWSLFQPPVSWSKGVDPTNDMQLTSSGSKATLKSLHGSGGVVRVTASDTMGHSAFSDITLEPDYRLSGLKATPGDAQVTLNWSSPLVRTPSVRIFYSTTGTVNTTSSYVTGSGGSYTHTGLTNGTTYFYRLAVVKPDGSLGPLTRTFSARPMTPRPTGLTATAGDGQVSLRWSAVAGATYELFWSTTPTVTTASNRIPVTGTSYTHTGLKNRTFYYYRVRAVKAGGASWLSKVVKARPMVPTPGGLKATAGNGQMSLSWSAVAGATYELFWSTTPTVNTASNRISLTTTSYTHTGLTNGTPYFYRVRAKTAGGASSLSPVVSDVPGIAGPAGLSLTQTAPGTLKLSWWPYSGATSYVVYWSNSPDVGPQSNKITGITGTTWTHTGLGPIGTQYFYRVQAIVGGVPTRLSSRYAVSSVYWPTVLAGSYTAGHKDGIGTSAMFNQPVDVAMDTSGNLYVVEYQGYVRKITPAGVVTTLASSGIGGLPGGLQGIAVDASGNVYVTADAAIYKITPVGMVTKLAGSGTRGFADGVGSAAQFKGLQGIAIDSIGNLYVADQLNSRVRKVSPTGVVTTLSSSIPGPSGIAVDASNNIYVTSMASGYVYKIDPSGASSIISNAGYFRRDIEVDASGNVYALVGYSGGDYVRKVFPAPSQNIFSIAPRNTTFAMGISGFCFDNASGNFYAVEGGVGGGNRIYKITP